MHKHRCNICREIYPCYGFRCAKFRIRTCMGCVQANIKKAMPVDASSKEASHG